MSWFPKSVVTAVTTQVVPRDIDDDNEAYEYTVLYVASWYVVRRGLCELFKGDVPHG